MNINQAKNEIKNTVQAYLAKDASGFYKIPSIRQRPILLMGPPGIGKTQIMEQIARECRIGLVAYTITHHTRQSAVGLPFIREEEFEGKAYSVTEYTMSEIIASVYRKREESGQKEGILFIDEINCVSETLAPTMLQFLQCKTFGNQAIPEGWIIVAAGNPPEYNKSVRDFDMVTLDRVRYLEIEAEYSVWKRYARENHLHPAILSYLDLRPKNFYRVEADVDGLQFVTARGWEDLSNLMYVYEELGLLIDETIVHEFLHHSDAAEDAAAYFDLYRKYRDDYGIAKILCGKEKPEVYARIDAAAFDERLSVVNLLLDGLQTKFANVAKERAVTDDWYLFLREYRQRLDETEDGAACYDALLSEAEARVWEERDAGFSTREETARREVLLKLWRENSPQSGCAKEESFQMASQGFGKQRESLEERERAAAAALECAFDFMEKAFAHGQEMVVFVTELAIRAEAAAFLAEHTCARYLQYNEQLLVGKRKAELLSELTQGM
ncbi:MAG: ATP-binding protein [Clostridiales bacterium]|nr:ATP-binding protein [Clostridiales bacterium]